MEIGKGWTKTKEQTKETYISCVLDDTFVALCPQLKDCGLILRHISPTDRKSEKSPHWTIRLYKQNDQRADIKQAEQSIQEEATKESLEDLEVEIPF